MSWGYANKLLAGEVQTLLAGAASGPPAGAGPGRVAAPRGTAGSDPGREGEDRRARAGAACGRASGVRREVEAPAGTRSGDLGGKPPKEPEAGPKDKDQVNFTDEESRIMPGATSYRATTRKRWWSRATWWRRHVSAANDKQDGAGAERVEEGRRRTGQAGSAGGAGTTARRTWSGAWNRTSSRISRAAGNTTTRRWKIVSMPSRSVLRCGCGDGDAASYADG